jgi:hypothetical protein
MPLGKINLFGGVLQWDSNDGQSRRVPLSDNDPVRSTYSYAVGSLAAATSATDVAVLEYPVAASGKVIRLRQIQLSGTAGSSAQYVLNVIKRSSLNSGGTRTTPTPVPRDNRLDAAFAVLGLYTVNPTSLGTAIGPMDGGRLTLAAPGGSNLDRLNLQYSWLNDMAPVLRTPGECFSLSFSGGNLAASSLIDISITWSEEEI